MLCCAFLFFVARQAVDFNAIDQVAAQGGSQPPQPSPPQAPPKPQQACGFDDDGIDWDAVDQAELAAMDSQQPLPQPSVMLAPR